MKMSSQSDNLEVVHEGWLTKSPPSKSIWRARWRRRWFVLRHSGELPGQYFLCYYTDKNCRKLKGRIDLDQCEQVDAGLKFEDRKFNYQHMFDVRTPKRTYYLAAESDEDMNRWVDLVCQVCGLKAYSQDATSSYFDFINPDEEEGTLSLREDESSLAPDSPPTSPASTASGPYIPISECFSGKPLNSPDGLSQFQSLQQQQQQRTSETYDAPRRLQPPPTPPHSPADRDDVFGSEEWVPNPQQRPQVNWETFPRPSDSSADGDTPHPSSTVTVGKRFTRNLDDVVIPIAPPRPPKPSHLNTHNYSNIDDIATTPDEGKGQLNDETYDFPRSHNLNGDAVDGEGVPVPQTRHCYSNAAPGKVNGNVFRYDIASTSQLTRGGIGGGGEASPSASDSSSVNQYSNLPSPAVSLSTPPPHPPAVMRELKPGRKDSAASSDASPLPPSIDHIRRLKPVPAVRRKMDTSDEGIHGSASGALTLKAPPMGRLGLETSSLRKPRAAPSPVPHASPNPVHRRNSDSCEDSYYDRGSFYSVRMGEEIKYLDLALDVNSSTASLPITPPGMVAPGLPSTTVYKTVDFIKTEAFNRTREKVEEERKGKGEKMEEERKVKGEKAGH